MLCRVAKGDGCKTELLGEKEASWYLVSCSSHATGQRHYHSRKTRPTRLLKRSVQPLCLRLLSRTLLPDLSPQTLWGHSLTHHTSIGTNATLKWDTLTNGPTLSLSTNM